MDSALENLSLGLLEYLPQGNTDLIEKAYRVSLEAHRNQRRLSGEAYLNHCVEVARILLSLRMDEETLAAGLLHDVLEDTSLTREDLRREFGEGIALLVEGVTKIGRAAKEGESATAEHRQAENLRKMILAMAKDIRVVLIKLSDRLHNLRTLQFLPEDRRRIIARETLELYAPLAARLGIFKIKAEMEDLSFQHLHPMEYESLAQKTERSAEVQEAQLKAMEAAFAPHLEAIQFPCKITVRPKNIYQIFRKMQLQNKPFEEIQDLLGVRILTDTVEHCYTVLAAIHANCEAIPGSFTDYIETPKPNFYQSIHTTVRVQGAPLEIQIRTEDMHHTAEYGIASHWRYKSHESVKGGGDSRDALDTKLNWLKAILEWQKDFPDPKEFMEALKVDLDFDQIFVFTPKGEVKCLPRGSTPVDFAYAIHSQIGERCTGAKIANRIVRLNHELQTGEACEILVAKGAHPTKDWLIFVKTASAKSKIRKYLREHEGK